MTNNRIGILFNYRLLDSSFRVYTKAMIHSILLDIEWLEFNVDKRLFPSLKRKWQEKRITLHIPNDIHS